MIQDIDKGWKKIMDQIQEDVIARVGVQDDSSRQSGEVTNLDLAVIHEFGTANGIPERSFIRSSFDDHEQEYGKLLETGAKLILSGKREPEKIIAALGEKVMSDIKRKIDSSVPPPLEQQTIDRKGSSVALIDTAQMKNSLTVKLE